MNFYQTLGIRATATKEEIDVAYNNAIKNADIERQLEVGMAYSILSNEDSRCAHDDELYNSLVNRNLEQDIVRYSAPQQYPHHNTHIVINNWPNFDKSNQSYSFDKTSPLISTAIWFMVGFGVVYLTLFILLVIG